MTREEQKKKIYYVQMSKDFFEAKNIQQLLATSAGDTIFRIYLQLWCKSLATGGMLPLEGDVPMAEELAIILGLLPLKKLALDRWQAELKIIESAVEICEKYRLIEVTECGIEFLMTDEYTRAWTREAIEKRGKKNQAQITQEDAAALTGPTEQPEETEEDQKKREKKEAAKRKKAEEEAAADEMFEAAWKMYPNKDTKSRVKKTRRIALYKIGRETIEQAIKLYISVVETQRASGFDRNWKGGAAFFNADIDGYIERVQNRETAGQKQTTQKPQAPIMITDQMVDSAIYGDDLTKENWDSKKAAYIPELQAAIEKTLFG